MKMLQFVKGKPERLKVDLQDVRSQFPDMRGDFSKEEYALKLMKRRREYIDNVSEKRLEQIKIVIDSIRQMHRDVLSIFDLDPEALMEEPELNAILSSKIVDLHSHENLIKKTSRLAIHTGIAYPYVLNVKMNEREKYKSLIHESYQQHNSHKGFSMYKTHFEFVADNVTREIMLHLFSTKRQVMRRALSA